MYLINYVKKISPCHSVAKDHALVLWIKSRAIFGFFIEKFVNWLKTNDICGGVLRFSGDSGRELAGNWRIFRANRDNFIQKANQ